jgi:putative SOS response-associated peptidase YedK
MSRPRLPSGEVFKSRRCLLPADAFYEWQKIDAKTKQPFAIAMKDGKPYAFAGLWEKWKDRKARIELLTFTVIMTDPKELIEPMAQPDICDHPAEGL